LAPCTWGYALRAPPQAITGRAFSPQHTGLRPFGIACARKARAKPCARCPSGARRRGWKPPMWQPGLKRVRRAEAQVRRLLIYSEAW